MYRGIDVPPSTAGRRRIAPSIRVRATVLLLALGCASDRKVEEVSKPGRDSAGIIIIENSSRTSAGRLVLTRLAVDTSGSGLEEVRLAARGPAGELALADRAAGRIVVFDSLGRPTSVLGRVGSGPGEFRALRMIHYDTAGHLIAFDPGNSRVTWFSGSGVIEREQTIAGAMAIGAFDDGRLLLRRIDAERALATEGVHRPPHLLSSLSADGATEAPIVSILGDEAVYERHPSMGLVYGPVPFGRATLTAIGPDRIVVADNLAFELKQYTADGKLTRIIRRHAAAVAVTTSVLEQYLTTLPGGGTEEGRRRHREAFARTRLPPTLPFVDALRLSRGGIVWVRTYSPPGQPLATWSAFRSDGALLAEGELPAAFTATSATDSTLLGVMEAADGSSVPAEAHITPSRKAG